MVCSAQRDCKFQVKKDIMQANKIGFSCLQSKNGDSRIVTRALQNSVG